jgi:hypothetical protein
MRMLERRGSHVRSSGMGHACPRGALEQRRAAAATSAPPHRTYHGTVPRPALQAALWLFMTEGADAAKRLQ